ncbi:P-loop ATPase, Sll1717 family [Pseudomonas sp. ESBL9]|uniref:P-loop ATPase, Sll1717 family n=1 Tax=Pseudomonas sp. ESBL9 TaxID=3077327 RepID=UPI002FCC1EC1
MITDWINIGEVSAERDANLSNYFFDAGVSAELVNNTKQYLLLGRKGAGKTAVFLHLLKKPKKIFSEKDIVIGMSLQSYNWQAHQLLSNDLKAGGFQHRDSWRFVLCVETIRAYLTLLHGQGTKIPKDLAAAEKVLKKLFDGPVPSWSELLGSKLFSLATAKLPDFSAGEEGVSVGGGEVSFENIKDDPSLRNSLNRNIENLTSWLEKCLNSVVSDIRIFLIFDRLDEAWITDFVSQSKSIICGLLHASEHILQKFNGRVRPLVFLREDIFSTFDINDRNKLREDCSKSLRWTQEAIESLALTRINFFARKAGIPEVSSLHEIFHEKEMRSRTPPAKHIFNRTMGRPRDMVAFLSRTFSTAKAEELYDKETDKISSKAIYAAEPGYSEYLYEELSDEWRNQNEKFHDYLGTLENLRYAAITTNELESALSGKGIVHDRTSFRNVARFLFENSIIGITVGDSKQWRYRCFYPTQAFVDTDVVKVHPGLIKRLGLTEGSSDKVGSMASELPQE